MAVAICCETLRQSVALRAAATVPDFIASTPRCE